MTRRVISLWLPRLATDRLRRAGSASAERPLVLTAESRGRRLLAAVDAVAEAAGLAPGMPLADARVLAPALDARPAEPAAEAALLSRLADWCGRYTPWTAVAGCDGIWLDVAGCAHLFGGEQAMLEDLLSRVAQLGFTARAALAATPGAAWALARHADRAAVVPAEETRDAIASLPVAGLRLVPETVGALHRLGLRRIGDLYPLPRASFAARFGEEAARRLDQALGRAAEPISPRRPAAPFEARLAFAEPIGHPDDIARGLGKLLEDLERRLERAGRGGRRLELTLFRVDGSVQRAAIGTARAVRDPAHLARLFAERLASLDPGFGIETMTLAAVATDKLGPQQVEATGIGAGAAAVEFFAGLLDRLGNRLGFERIARLRPAASHLPERAQRLVPTAWAADALTLPPLRGGSFPLPPGVAGRPPHMQGPGDTPGGPRAGEGKVGDRALRLLRPLRLLREAEPIILLTPEGEDGTPPALFRWRRRLYQTCRAEGPERIALEWWRHDRRQAGRSRDYWRIEDAEGPRLWLYREGGNGESRWFMQGLFA